MVLLQNFDELLHIAEQGDHRNIDMLVGDIYGDSDGAYGLPADLIASSFGKAARSTIGLCFIYRYVFPACDEYFTSYAFVTRQCWQMHYVLGLSVHHVHSFVRSFVRSFVHPVSYCYQDIWMKLTWNIY